jgi:hypothetical protein
MAHTAINASRFLAEIERLKPLENLVRFIPTGGGKEGKAPLISEWSNHPGFTIKELIEQFPHAKSVGVITQPLLCFDFDGATAVNHAVLDGRDPDDVNTWRINRTTDKNRFKLLFLPSKEQLAQLPNGQITNTHRTKRPSTERYPYEEKTFVVKGEAEEIFCHPGRQVIVAGAHPASGGHYFWPNGSGPEALSAPPAEWWGHVLTLARDYPHPAAGADKTVSTSRFASGDWQRLEHCPICGRGPDDNPLCQIHSDSQTLRCFLGQTFSPPTNLEPGELVPGTEWAFSRVSSSGWGEFLTFVKDKPSRYQQVKSMLRRRTNGN